MDYCSDLMNVVANRLSTMLIGSSLGGCWQRPVGPKQIEPNVSSEVV